MRVIGVSRTPREVDGFDKVVKQSELAEIVREADYVINILPSSTENYNLFGEEVFRAMKPTSYFH
jgi:phosphoglycerate dehydrogenase-like enzyme